MNNIDCPCKECDHPCGILIIKDPCDARKEYDKKLADELEIKHEYERQNKAHFMTAGMTVKNSKKRGQK